MSGELRWSAVWGADGWQVTGARIDTGPGRDDTDGRLFRRDALIIWTTIGAITDRTDRPDRPREIARHRSRAVDRMDRSVISAVIGNAAQNAIVSATSDGWSRPSGSYFRPDSAKMPAWIRLATEPT